MSATDGQIDWYHLAHGRLKREGWWVPDYGYWLLVYPDSRRVGSIKKNLQASVPLGWGPAMELWWTDEEVEFPYEREHLYLHDGKLTEHADAA